LCSLPLELAGDLFDLWANLVLVTTGDLSVADAGADSNDDDDGDCGGGGGGGGCGRGSGTDDDDGKDTEDEADVSDEVADVELVIEELEVQAAPDRASHFWSSSSSSSSSLNCSSKSPGTVPASTSLTITFRVNSLCSSRPLSSK
jgi:hypothetical protein